MSDNDKLPTKCVRCGKEEELTTAETLVWMKQHGPGKCEKKSA